MTGPSHYKRAEVLLGRSNGEDLEYAQLLVAQAQVHATLALAAATVDAANSSAATYETRDGETAYQAEPARNEPWQEALS